MIKDTTISLTLAFMSKILARLLITSWIFTWINSEPLWRTSSITKAPTVIFGYLTFAKMPRPCNWWMSVLSLIWNCVMETWLFSVLRLIPAPGSKCSTMHPITNPSQTFSTCIWWAITKLRSKRASPTTKIASLPSKICPWHAQLAYAGSFRYLSKLRLKVTWKRVKARCSTWRALHSGWVLPVPFPWS